MPRSTLGFGEPHHGKCDCDACGGRIKAQTSRLRAAGDIMGTSARSISAGLNAQVYDPHDKVYHRSVTHDLTDANIDAVAAHRAAYMPGKYPGSKKARQVMWSDAKHAVGFRDLCCKCVPCVDGRYADCDLVELTLGEPVWLPSHEAAAVAEAAVVAAAADAHAAVVAAMAAGEAVRARVAQDGLALEYAAAELKGDRKIVLTAVAQNARAVEYAAAELQGDREIVLAAVAQAGSALEYAVAELKGDREIVLAAVAQEGSALQYAVAELQGDRKSVV